MTAFNKLYEQQLKEIAEKLQSSELLEAYLEEEDEEMYKALTEAFEPEMDELYNTVALQEPLQLPVLEKAMLSDDFEGAFLPRLLGYAVLRAEVDDYGKYTRSNEWLHQVLTAICNSANFEYIKARIGQSLQIAFALSSDIFITEFIEEQSNKKIKQYLLSQKLPKYMHEAERLKSYTSYRVQFSKFNFYTTEFPTDLTSQRLHFYTMSTFLKQRAIINQNNQSFLSEFIKYLGEEQFHFTREHTIILGLLINYFDLKKAEQDKLAKILNKLRDADNFNDIYFDFIFERFNSKLKLTAECDKRVASLVDFKKADDELTRYYQMASTLAEKGYMHNETIETIRSVYNMYEGMSLFNECVRRLVLGHFDRFINNLEPSDYQEYFEVDKYMRVYIDIFNNQQFNQNLSDFCIAFVRRCLKVYTDKRSKDYQDIKKFITHQFLELKFLRDKELVELFKTKRKKKTA